MAFNKLSGLPFGFLSGYDIFISYTRSDGKNYANKLYEQLTSLDFSCFIDRKEVPGGRPLTSSLMSAIKGSKTYLLVGTERAFARDYIKLEFTEFAKTGRTIIPISVNHALTDSGAMDAEPWNIIKQRDIVWLDESAEALDKALPSPEVYEAVQNLFHYTRRNVKRRRWVSAATFVILLAAFAAIWQGTVAAQRLSQINEEISKAQKQKDEYDRQIGQVKTQLEGAQAELGRTRTDLDQARGETAVANERRARAESNALKAEDRERLANAEADRAQRRARANAIVLAADSSYDPLTSALLLTELPSDDEPADGIRVAQRLAATILPRAAMRGHTKRLVDVAFSPDKKLVVTASEDGTARVWPVDGIGDPVILKGHRAGISRVSFSDDGSLLATASKDGTARVWRSGNTDPAYTLSHPKPVLTAQFTFNNERLVTLSEDGVVRVWKLGAPNAVTVPVPDNRVAARVWLSRADNGGMIATSDGSVWRFKTDAPLAASVDRGTSLPEGLRDKFPESGMDKIFFSPDGSHMALFFNNNALVQSTDDASEAFLLNHDDRVNSIDFTADGSKAITACSDGKVRVWSTKDGKTIQTLDPKLRVWVTNLYGKQPEAKEDTPVRASRAILTNNGNRIVTFYDDGVIRLWDVGITAEPVELRGHAGADIAALASDDSQLVTGADDGSARIWPMEKSREPLVFSHTKPVYKVSFSRDESRIITGAGDGIARVWWVGGENKKMELDVGGGIVRGVAFDGTGSYALTASEKGVVRIWDIRDESNPSIDKEFVVPGERLIDAQFSPDETRIMARFESGKVRIWQRSGDRAPITLVGPEGYVWQAQFSSGGGRLLAAYDDGTARIWKVDGSGDFVELAGKHRHTATILGATFSPDESRVLTVSQDGTARIWPADGKGDPVILKGADPANDWLENCAFSPDGKKVVTTSSAGRAWIWNVDGKGEPFVLRNSHDIAHIGSIMKVSYSQDGRQIITIGGMDGMTRVWPSDGDGRPVSFPGHGGSITYAEMSFDGSRIVTASEDGTARVWRTKWQDLLGYLKKATSATLSVEQRITLLGENDEKARKGYERAERSFGRTPLPLNWRFNYPF